MRIPIPDTTSTDGVPAYCDVLPSGWFAALAPNRCVKSHVGDIDLPGENVLFLRITDVGGFGICGQGHQSGHAWLWREGAWTEHGPTNGTSPCIFDRAGELQVVRPGDNVTSQGYRFVSPDGRVWLGDETMAWMEPDGELIHEYTVLGDVTIGQGHEDSAHVLCPVRRRLEAGATTFIRATERDGLFAVAMVTPEGAVLHLIQRAELDALPLVGAPPVVVPTIDPPKDKEPTVPAFPFDFNPTGRLEALRAGFPTPLGARHAEFLVKACKTVGNGAGLLKKDGGTHIQLPNGVNVSQDWMVFPNGSGCDFLSDGEGAATVGWGEAQENPGTLVDVSGLFVDDGGGDKPPIDPPDTGDLRNAVLALAGRVAKLEQQGPGDIKGRSVSITLTGVVQ